MLGIHEFSKLAIVIIPFLASVIVFLKSYTGVSFPIPTDLLVLYVASLSFYVASTLFDVKCPEIISRFKTFDNYLQFYVAQIALSKTSSIDTSPLVFEEIIARIRPADSEIGIEDVSNNKIIANEIANAYAKLIERGVDISPNEVWESDARES